MSRLILASSSPFRQELLKRLNLPFQAISPDVDETREGSESALTQVMRLARAKALAIARVEKDALIIGSDQLATCHDVVFTKPGNHERAREQLKQMAGQSLFFHTGLCLLNSNTGAEQLDCVNYKVHFRNYSDDEIERYLLAEKPYGCAASFKSEKLGISLLESMEGPDPSALIGLPLLRLCEMLRREGCYLP